MTYIAPTDLKDALSALDAGPYSVIAGGTDWYPAQGEKPISVDMLDISRIKGLRGISRTDAGWRIGAASTWSDLLSADLPTGFDGLKAAAREVGSVQIQNAGTIAGNLCNASPAADGVPPLLTLDCSVELSSKDALRVLPLTEFLLGPRQTALAPGELLTAILVPDVAGSRSAFVKLGARKYLVISIAMVAVRCTLADERVSDVRIAVGACSAVAQRLPDLEAALAGVQISQVGNIVAQADLSALAPIDDVRGSAGYRLDVVAPLIARAMKEATDE
ncbi:MAG: xanthine dehydrogenase family protein subunit M [Planktotalea sp.]|uniref:FAD binding domain-containing protein n=1 Tax=Planktotalea sp. TaxID=2029877 RepID=UPI003C706E46